MTNGLAAINKHSTTPKEYLKDKESLNDYQNKPIKRNKVVNEREILDLINSKFL